MTEKNVKITFEVDGIQQTVNSVEDLQDALKGVDNAAKKTEKSVEDAANAAKDLGDSAKEAGEAGEGAIAVLDEATGGLASRVKNVGSGLKAMGKSAVSSFKGAVAGANAMGKALIATGIGAIVVALGLIVAYWDDIKGLVSGVSSDQKQLLANTEAEVAARQQALDATSAQENSLKLAGKSEREIRDLKIQQTEEVILATQAQLEQQKQMKEAQLAAAERNQKIAKGVIAFLTAPITILLGAIDQLTKGLAYIGVLNEGTTLAADYLEKTSSWIFDPEEVAAEGDATIAETEKALAALKNQRDGYRLQNQAEDKKAREDKLAADKAAADEAAAYEAQKAQELADLKKQIREAEANTEAELRAKELEDLDNYYAELIAKAEANGLATDELEASRLEKMNALKQKYADEDQARRDQAAQDAKDKADYEKMLEQSVQDAKLGVATAAFDTISQIAGEESAAGKAAAVASATINTYQAATNALANTPAPPPFPQIAAGVAIASGLLNVKKILSTKVPGPDSGGGALPSVPSTPSVRSFDPNAALSAAATGQDLANTVGIADGNGQPTIKAYVVSSEMTSQQEADKKIDELASL